MTNTVISSASKEVVIGFDQPFVVIGERINPTGRKLLAEEMKAGDYSRVEADALAQVAAGAQVRQIEKIETAVAEEFQNHFVAAMTIPHQSDRFDELAKVVELPAAKEAQPTGGRKRRQR